MLPSPDGGSISERADIWLRVKGKPQLQGSTDPFGWLPRGRAGGLEADVCIILEWGFPQNVQIEDSE